MAVIPRSLKDPFRLTEFRKAAEHRSVACAPGAAFCPLLDFSRVQRR
jgi:hypothetical protein